ncbi:iron-regulated ABC transporter permease protein SufD [Salana multivorans]|uniref:Iron-regulated ABC transporter permease protein SufD n=1 Tax=Salana multivorans TaxID=120377 RepID=A0A3N2D1W4_9MICO|nr:Fe-S cluster assembly protein SufD [Salana multivorans]ROR93765.1 iron-regulated ABC transporter permease protein SufD [Salana multivorans]
MTATDLSTDHSRAVADGAHTHSSDPGGVGEAPESSRAARLRSFDVADFPEVTGSEEEWRFSAVDVLAPVLADRAADGHLEWTTTPQELPVGVTLTRLDPAAAVAASVQAPGDRAAAIAVARSGGATALSVARNTVVDEPVEITLTGRGDDVRGHLVITVGESSEVTVIIDRVGSATYSEFVSVDVADNAHLNLVLLQSWDSDAVHAGEVVARLGRDARLRGTVVSLGGRVVRLNTSAAFAAPGGDIELFGLYYSDAGQHLEHQLFVDHAAPNCRSRVTYKGALQGKGARSVWIGDVLIRKEAEGTDTYELNRNLVLTDGARADSVPNLEIETGEIEGAGHASATGRFDDEQLFYLKARGIPEDVARRLVVRGFFAELIQQIGVERVEQRLIEAIEAELEVTGA